MVLCPNTKASSFKNLLWNLTYSVMVRAEILEVRDMRKNEKKMA